MLKIKEMLETYILHAKIVIQKWVKQLNQPFTFYN